MQIVKNTTILKTQQYYLIHYLIQNLFLKGTPGL